MITSLLLISPLALSVDPQRVDFDENYTEPNGYSYETQTPEYTYGDVVGKPNTMSFTYGGTQTFDFQGKPRDSDNDSD